jgi:lipopolysaccharide export LptBFGC system permease protein LptF
MLVPFAAGTLVFLAVILANTIIKSSDAIFQLRTPWLVICRWLFYRVPFILALALPVGAMLATSLTIIRLGRDNELTPLRLGGLSVRRALLPFYFAGLAISATALFVNERVTPAALARSNEILAKVILQQGDRVVKPNATFRAGGETFCHVSRVDMQRAEMEFVLIYRFHAGRPQEALSAPRCVREHGGWVLLRGQHTWFDAEGRRLRSETFERYPVAFAANLVALWDEDKEPEQLTLREIHERLRLLEQSGDRQTARDLRYFAHTRFALPLTCLIFTLLAAPLSLRFARPQASPFAGVFLTIVVVFLANGTINWAKTLTLQGQNAWFSPLVGAWLHVWVFGALAVWLIARAEQ